ncbi:MAG: hypothetical protein HY690_19495 [Chloroflexi bacterium]|nr:hypothetical protein [Chloroflexota bacterium]
MQDLTQVQRQLIEEYRKQRKCWYCDRPSDREVPSTEPEFQGMLVSCCAACAAKQPVG